jgi:hypothetical protein
MFNIWFHGYFKEGVEKAVSSDVVGQILALQPSILPLLLPKFYPQGTPPTRCTASQWKEYRDETTK